ncbi:MAG: glycosyltransferase family 1 protein [Verrucomicrobiota bacterium]|nr:glycosyltransferase family 1 protein [Verrucomicrobiota bacterium]
MSSEVLIDFRMHRNSGIGRFITNLVGKLHSRGKNLRLLASSKDISSLTLSYPNAKISIFDTALFTLKEQLGHTAYRQPAIIHAPHFNHPILARRPDVLTIYDMFAFQYPGFFRNKRIAGLKILLPILLKRTKLVHCISKYTADCLVHYYPSVSPQIRIIHLGIESRFQPTESRPDSIDKPYFLYVGNLSPHKNLPALIEALALFSQSGCQYRLVIIGKSFKGQMQLLEELIRSRGLSEQVMILSGLNDQRLLEFYSHATALIHPSLSEGFGFTPLEAMACGTPALISRAGSLPEVCGDAALYFDPLKPEEIAARMKQIVLEKNLRQEMIERGKARAKEFTWEKCVDGIIELYKEAASKK